MIVKELISLIGVYEPVKIADDNFNELCFATAIDVPEEFGEKFIKSVFSHDSVINIIILDKHKRKWYNNNKESDA